MKTFFTFGERVEGYDVPVLNEREVRAAAGILFVFAFFSFMQVWLVGNYFFIKLFVSGFLFDFIIRLFISPNYAPTLILGKLITRQQKVEYTGAPQKRFAWTLGLLMSLYMFYSLMIVNQASVVTCILCMVCLTLLFFETAFGICIGCMLYNATHKNKAHFCPGGVCEVHQVAPVQRTGAFQLLLVVLFILGMWWLATSSWVYASQAAVSGQDCLLNRLPSQANNTAVSSCSLLE